MIAWTDIVAECGNYKAGFVATFRKYEGEATDERDGSNRVVKVTAASFAEHMGIPVRTFQNWVKQDVDANFSSTSAKQARTAASHANVIKNMAKRDPRALADAIHAAGVGASDQAFQELKQRRAGIDTSTANRKAGDAKAHAAMQPIEESLHRTDVELCVASLEDATEYLRDALAAEAVNARAAARIDKAHNEFQIVLAEARFQLA